MRMKFNDIEIGFDIINLHILAAKQLAKEHDRNLLALYAAGETILEYHKLCILDPKIQLL